MQDHCSGIVGSSPTLGEPLASSQGAEKKAENRGSVNSFEKPGRHSGR